MNGIRWIDSQDIDIDKWNNCVINDEKARIYNRYEYVQAMSDQWLGLVIGDYVTVLACPYKTKLGLRLLANPPFVQQLSICGEKSEMVLNEIFAAINKKFSIIDFASEYLATFTWRKCSKRTNFYLPLDKDYEDLYNAFSKPCKRNLAKIKPGLVYENGDFGEEIIRLYQAAYGNLAGYNSTSFERLLQLNTQLLQLGLAENYLVRDAEGEIVYGSIIWKDDKRLYYILGAPTAKGRELRVTYWFINQLINKNAACGLVLDFEGSDIKNVADFYKSFNPEVENYYVLYSNSLPFPLNKLLDKKLNKA